jgi:hypothetical protein
VSESPTQTEKYGGNIYLERRIADRLKYYEGLKYARRVYIVPNRTTFSASQPSGKKTRIDLAVD